MVSVEARPLARPTIADSTMDHFMASAWLNECGDAQNTSAGRESGYARSGPGEGGSTTSHQVSEYMGRCCLGLLISQG